jgi:hypothetical protein
MPQGGDLGCFDAAGQAGGSGRDVGAKGVAGRGVVITAGEKAGEKASETQGGNFQEAAFGARGGQKRHELGSKALHTCRNFRKRIGGHLRRQ